jgi:hypothetical protein
VTRRSCRALGLPRFLSLPAVIKSAGKLQATRSGLLGPHHPVKGMRLPCDGRRRARAPLASGGYTVPDSGSPPKRRYGRSPALYLPHHEAWLVEEWGETPHVVLMANLPMRGIEVASHFL